MNYRETLDFLYSRLPAYHRIGKAAYKNNLGNTISLDEYFGHPHQKYLTIHVAGTNGKGSVSHMIASVLQEAGYKTGLYTSPHLRDFRERIRIDGRMIGEETVISFVKEHRNILESVFPSFFEMTVAMAFYSFKEQKTDIAVIEAGLGGRLDSTNIISPQISVITNIGHDHMDLLGDTLEKVAIEKAGIIKRGVPVVIGETSTETKKVFIDSANDSGSDIYFADQNFTCRLDQMDPCDNLRGFLIGDIHENKNYEGNIPLGGDYQSANLKTLFQVFKCLEGKLKLTEGNITAGIRNVVKNTGLQGRWQILKRDPLIICDTGHNKEGLEFVLRQIKEIPAHRRHMIIGFVSDKNLDSILPLFPSDSEYYFTRASVPRAMDEKVLMAAASRYGLQGTCYHEVNEALKAAIEKALPSDLIFVGGSTFVVAEVV